jgi:signal transduction histidine kinase
MTTAWQRLGLRARLLLVGVLGVAVALAIGSVALYTVLTLVSFRTLDDSGDATATDVATLVEQGRLPDPIPVTGDQIVQVVDSRDRVVSASVNADRLTALLLPAELDRAAAGRRIEVPGSRVGLDSPLRVLAVRVGTGATRSTVLVAQQFDVIEHSQRILRLTLLATYPVLLAALALIAWRIMEAALRPVEVLRSSADRISGTGQDLRLPVSPARDEIQALAITLNSMLDRLSASRARQRSFVADAAHELRSPLASMRAQLEIADRLGEGTESSADLHAEVLRMSALVEDLLTLARFDGEPRPGEWEPVDLRQVLAVVVGRYEQARVPVHSEVTGCSLVRGRPQALQRVLANLLDNAVRHASSVVAVSVSTDGAHVLLTVSDDGPGIAEGDRERAFERFTRLDAARHREGGGSGLGLAIVRELVEDLGGRVDLDGSPLGGLAARVTLPRAEKR